MMSHSVEVRERLFWLSDPSWYSFDETNGYRLTDVAPQKARDSFEKWKKHQH